jgi:hypothetical protein
MRLISRAIGNDADVRVLANRTPYGMLRGWAEPGDPVFATLREFVMRLSARP